MDKLSLYFDNESKKAKQVLLVRNIRAYQLSFRFKLSIMRESI